jgi:hypothetical protein
MQQAAGGTAQAMERLERLQSVSSAPTVVRKAELENPLGVLFRVRSVETPPEVRGMPHAAGARLLPREFAELATGAQENATQHPDACSASLPSPLA